MISYHTYLTVYSIILISINQQPQKQTTSKYIKQRSSPYTFLINPSFAFLVLFFINSEIKLRVAIIIECYNYLCCEVRASYPTPYQFQFGEGLDGQNKQKFQSNEIKTTKYNIFNFLPKSIISQYKRLANLYFLIVAIVSTIPDVTPLNPALIWAAILFVLIISIIKERTNTIDQVYQDYNRYQTDKQVNGENQVQVQRGNMLIVVKWKELIVGDICKIKEQQTFPADLILMGSSDKDGVAYIQTATLDGELTSKIRYGFKELQGKFSENEVKFGKGIFEGESPCPSLSQFKGTLDVDGRRLTISDNSQVLYRGAKLKNTEWVWGLVAYTGQCSKIMMNGQNFSTKLSNLEKRLNTLLMVMLGVQLAACLVLSALSVRKYNAMVDTQTYLIWFSYSGGANFIMKFLMFFVESSSCIPVSLLVTVQIAKTVQSYFIDFDQLMYSTWRDSKAFARIASLNQQLGQVEYLFCDKTGTLTKNLLTFHTAVIGNDHYTFTRSNKTYLCPQLTKFLQGMQQANYTQKISYSQGPLTLNNHLSVMQDYLMALLVCNNIHTVGDREEKVGYESESPDEIALTQLARDCGFELLKRDKDSLLVSIHNVRYRVEVVARFAFSSERKRMSIIIKWKGVYLLYSKGADNIILEKSDKPKFNIPYSIDKLTFAGLRSLLVAMRVLPEKEVRDFIREYESAGMGEREEVKEKHFEGFESRLTIIGATGLLDELQDGVPQTLRDIQRAGIKVWMLTGDKLETALEIAKSCSLVHPDYEVVLMRNSFPSFKDTINEARSQIGNPLKKYSLLVEGGVLAKISNNEEMEREFAELSLFFTTVVCCRLLPVQKAQVVGMVKRVLGKICLAVGDGGNDVSMIKQASIGVGIYGEQGMSAVQASDYAIPEFRMLWRLLFVHGRWNYIRISQLILYFIYKSLIFTLPRFLYAFNNAFSGYSVYDDYYIALYNVLFTAFPLLVRALFEQDFNYVVNASENQLDIDSNPNNNIHCDSQYEKKYIPKGYKINEGLRMLFPKIYYIGQKNVYFNLKECLLWLLEAILIGGCILFFIIRGIDRVSINQKGLNGNLPFVSVTVFTSVILITTVKLCMQVKYWTKLLFFVIIFLSLAPYFGFMWLLNSYFLRPVERILVVAFTSPKGYLAVVFLLLVLMAINGVMVYIRFNSHSILKRMTIAVEQDRQMIEYISQQHELSSSQQRLRESESPISQGPKKCHSIHLMIQNNA